MQDKKFSVIVPLYRDNWKRLPDLLFHLKEQDYKNYEVILSYNSPVESTRKETQKILRKERAWLSPKEVDAGYDPALRAGNHCAAFNAGATVATGDFLLFLDPDICLLPGVLREYKDAFEEHPEADFVYGHYDLAGAGRIMGRRYSEYELRCANYVSGAFPIRKAAFRGWDPSVLSLQDWDMWLSAVDAGAKGHFLDRPCFIADAPVVSGISAEGSSHWLERYAYVRTKHGFPPSNTVVTSLGAPDHATNVARILGADVRVLSNVHTYKPHSYRNVYVVGFYVASGSEDPQRALRDHMSLFYEGGDLKGKMVPGSKVIHWIGTDIFMLQHKVSWSAEKFVSRMLTDPELGITHLCECAATQAELRELGIKAKVVPLPSGKTFTEMPLPKSLTVGIYVNPTQDMYFEDSMYEVADAMPDISFRFFGNRPKRIVENKEWVGFVDMEKFLPTVSAVVRCTVHDGLPLGPVEAMTAGRQVITTQPLEYGITHVLKNGEIDTAALIGQIRALKETSLDPRAPSHWRSVMSPASFRKAMAKVLA